MYLGAVIVKDSEIINALVGEFRKLSPEECFKVVGTLSWLQFTSYAWESRQQTKSIMLLCRFPSF